MSHRKTLLGQASVVAVVLCSRVSHAQQRIWYADGPGQDTEFGLKFDLTTDVDAYGLHQLLIGAPGATCSSPGDGIASLFSVNGGELQRWCGSGEELGVSVSVIGDLDGDGKEDFVLGCPRWDNPNTSDDAGRFLVVSSATGAVLLEVDGTEVDGTLGPVQALPDYDNDGTTDILAAEPGYAYASPYQAGRVRVYSGKDGSILREYIGENEGDVLGTNLALLGDVDADGVMDYAIAALMAEVTHDRGKVYVYSGKTGTLIWSWTGQYDYDQFGISIADAGDLDGDGYADVMCGGIEGPRKVWGHVTAFSGKTGKQIFDLKDSTFKGQAFGQACAMAGDMNSDGFEEFLVGAPFDGHVGYHYGRVDLFSGRTRRLLYHYYPESSDVYALMGWYLKSRVDWNGDKIPDFAVTSLGHDSTRGRVSIFAGNDLFLQSSDTNPAPNTDVTLNVRGGPAGALVMDVVVGVDGDPTWETITLATLDANGELDDVETVPPEVSGHDFTLIGYAINAKGKLIDTGTEVVSVQ